MATATRKKAARKNTSKPTRKPAPKATKVKARATSVKASKATAKPAKSAPAGMSFDTLRERAVAHLKYTHEQFLKFADGFSKDQVIAQPMGVPNHVIWQLGHLTVTYHWFASMLDGNQTGTPEGYGKLFGHGSAPTSNAGEYPTFDEAKREFNASLDRLVKAANAGPSSRILTDVSKPSDGWCPDCLDMLHKAAWHNGWHLGQTSVLRKMLGLPSVYA